MQPETLLDVTSDDILRAVNGNVENTNTDKSKVSLETSMTIANFCMLWNLYERTFFDKLYSNGKLLIELEKDTPTIKVIGVGDRLQFFRKRYVEHGSFTPNYVGLDRIGHTKAEHTQMIESALLDTNNSTNAEFALLAIIFRLRNNLFHGEKTIGSLNDQRNSFIVANRVLLSVLTGE